MDLGHFNTNEIYTDCVILAIMELQLSSLILMAILYGGDYDVSMQDHL